MTAIAPPLAPLVTIADMADLLRTTRGQVYRMHAEGRLPPSVKIGRRVYFRPEDVRAWIDNSVEAPSSQHHRS